MWNIDRDHRVLILSVMACCTHRIYRGNINIRSVQVTRSNEGMLLKISVSSPVFLHNVTGRPPLPRINHAGLQATQGCLWCGQLGY